jgi:hypothetical protein
MVDFQALFILREYNAITSEPPTNCHAVPHTLQGRPGFQVSSLLYLQKRYSVHKCELSLEVPRMHA